MPQLTREQQINRLKIEIQIVWKLKRLYESELQPYLENDDMDHLPESKWNYLEMLRKINMREIELHEKLESLGLTIKEICDIYDQIENNK